MVKNLPKVQESQVPSLSLVEPLEREMATHSGILAWEIPLSEDLGMLQSMGSQKRSTGLSNLTSNITNKLL